MNENSIVVGTRSGVLRCAKCNTPVVLMKGDYIFGVGYDCPKCEGERNVRECAACADAVKMLALGWDDYYCHKHNEKQTTRK